tara:strand:- start:645 stop:896 length:252 start_codon:yes stop_codon:yes gene_type:complete
MADALYERLDNGSYEWTDAGYDLARKFQVVVEAFLDREFGPDEFGPSGQEDYDVLDARSILEGTLSGVMTNVSIKRRLTRSAK